MRIKSNQYRQSGTDALAFVWWDKKDWKNLIQNPPQSYPLLIPSCDLTSFMGSIKYHIRSAKNKYIGINNKAGFSRPHSRKRMFMPDPALLLDIWQFQTQPKFQIIYLMAKCKK